MADMQRIIADKLTRRRLMESTEDTGVPSAEEQITDLVNFIRESVKEGNPVNVVINPGLTNGRTYFIYNEAELSD